VFKLRSYISLLFLLLLLFPVVEKVQHELEHSKEQHCGFKDTHYCEVEHTCVVCDYVFSAASEPPVNHSQLAFFSPYTKNIQTGLVFNLLVPKKYTLSLRGPPNL
jgi:hypothetical protein